MSGLQAVSAALCCTCVAVSIISVLIPQKRTRSVMSFVVGLFFLSTFIGAVCTRIDTLDLSTFQSDAVPIPTYGEDAYQDAVAQLTADNLTETLDELLQNEGIQADDIRLTLKISDEGRITVVRAVIYISGIYSGRITDIESVVYRNIAKEPEIYVTGEEAQRMAE